MHSFSFFVKLKCAITSFLMPVCGYRDIQVLYNCSLELVTLAQSKQTNKQAMRLCLPSNLQKVKSRSFPLTSMMQVGDIVSVQEAFHCHWLPFQWGLDYVRSLCIGP